MTQDLHKPTLVLTVNYMVSWWGFPADFETPKYVVEPQDKSQPSAIYLPSDKLT